MMKTEAAGPVTVEKKRREEAKMESRSKSWSIRLSLRMLPAAKTPRALQVSQRRPIKGRSKKEGALKAAATRPTVVAEPSRWTTQRAMIGMIGVWLAYERKPPAQS